MKQSKSLSNVPWFRQNHKLIFCTALLFICNIFSLMVLFQTIEEKSKCDDDVTASLKQFVEPGTGRFHTPSRGSPNSQSTSSTSSKSSKTSGTDAYTTPSNYKNPNPDLGHIGDLGSSRSHGSSSQGSTGSSGSSGSSASSSESSIQSRLNDLTDTNLMPFQRYKNVEHHEREGRQGRKQDIPTGANGADAAGRVRKDEGGGGGDDFSSYAQEEDALPRPEINLEAFETERVKYLKESPFELGLHRECSQLHFASRRLPMLVKLWEYQRDRGYFLNFMCPNSYKIEFRPSGLSPHVLGNECAPGWPADVVFILSKLLHKNMLAVQYGISVSNIWIALYVQQLYAVDTRGDTYDDFTKKLAKTDLDLSNARIEFMRMSKKYVQQVAPSRGKVVDLIVMETVPSFHDDVLRYAVSVLKPNNGILVLRYDWYTPDYIEENITKLIPPTWVRYNSHILPEFVEQVPFSQERYIENAKTSLWISSTLEDNSDTSVSNSEGDPCQS